MVILASSVASVLIISIFIGIIRFLRPSAEEKRNAALDFAAIEIAKPDISEMYLTVNPNSRPQIALKQVKGIVIHYTANPGTDAKANRNYFESRKDCADASSNKVSSHYIIGLDGTIIQCIPDNEIAYASNNRNKDTISIECCHPDNTGKFTENTYQSLVHLTAYLCDKYEIYSENVIRHYDVTKKMCPKYYVKHPDEWEVFKEDVIDYLESGKKDTIK
ncbi:MAG: peptidoglycan recognition family protein [bacterium]|nr:peptidoglycan recognition family protein [bacterium]